MAKFGVSVEKTLYCTGVIEVEAENATEAEEKVNSGIIDGTYTSDKIDWDDPEYDDFSFKTTGDVE